VKRKEVVSILTRELLAPLGDVDLRRLDRSTLVERIGEVEQSGRPGAAGYLRGKVTPFLNWCVDAGLLAASPLAGWRRSRRSRAERLTRAGRALEDRELPILWWAADAAAWPLPIYLRVLLLTGQRRTETALMRWPDLDLDAGAWTIPAGVTKSGRGHRVPLAPEAVALLGAMPRLAGSSLVFPGRNGKAVSGWSKRLAPVMAATAAAGMRPWSLHDCRRTFRTGLGSLGVAPHVAELLVNHSLSDELAAIYDRGEYQQQRVEAADRWASHVRELVEAGTPRVVPMRRAAS
jgi:integrase